MKGFPMVGFLSSHKSACPISKDKHMTDGSVKSSNDAM